MTNCNQIAVESARLKAVFTKCSNLKAIDLRAIVDLIESVNACAGGSFNLKTINGQSLVGIGDITITATTDGTETKVQQGTGITVTGNGSIANPYIVTNTTTQADGSETKINQGSNITVAGAGTIASPYVINAIIPANASQVNSDWASISGVSQILNKPIIPAAQVNSDWEATSGPSVILNKPSLSSSGSQDNFVRVINIPFTSLPNTGTIEEDICLYILGLPEATRTILETDSKWNVSLNYPPSFAVSESNVVDYCSSEREYTFSDICYVNYGVTSLDIGVTVYRDIRLTIPKEDGVYDTELGKMSLVSGVVIFVDCGR